MQYFYENRHFKNQASVALNPLVSLFGRLVARSGRKRGNRQTDGRTDGQTYRPSTVTLAAHARRGLIKGLHCTEGSSWFMIKLRGSTVQRGLAGI